MDVNNRCVPGQWMAGPRFSSDLASRPVCRPHRCVRAVAGLTLIEILLALAVSAILLGLGIPAFSSLLGSSELTTRVNALSASLSLARSAAIREGSRGMVCQSRDGRRCSRGGDWSEGWIVFVDRNHNRQREDTEPLLHAQPATRDRVHIRFRGFPSRRYFIYRPDGMAKMNGTFILCVPGEPALARAVIVSWSGRPRISDRRADGRPLRCPAAS